MRDAAGLLLLGLVGLSGCVERLIVERDAGGSGSESDSTTTGSSGEPVWSTEGVQCNGPQDCPTTATCFEGVCVGTGELRISLTWRFISDLDLHVTTPDDTHISFENPDAGGGLLDVDDCVSGSCLDQDGTHVENVYFPDRPPAGRFRVYVENYDGNAGGPFEILVSGVTNATFTGTMPASPTTSQVFVFEI